MKAYKEVEDYIVGRLKRELPDNLFYHGIHHTFDVLSSAEMIARHEGVTDRELMLLKVAVLYHDAGFIKTYKNHEEEGCKMAQHDLPGFGYNQDEIDTICGMIMATKIPQNPKNKLERIIADADLEYLGTDKFKPIGQTLFDEMKIYVNLESERQWNIIQMNFLTNHHYHTDFCKQNREARKQQNLAEIVEIVKNYD